MPKSVESRSRIRRIALLGAVLMGVAGFVLLNQQQRAFRDRVSGGAKVPVLVAVRDIPMGAVVRAESLATREIPERYVGARHIPAADADKVIGIRSTMELRANEVLLWTDLATAADTGRFLSGLVKSGMRAVTVRIEHGASLGGLLRPGDRVDLLLRAQRENEMAVLPLLQNVLVLAVGRDMGGEANILKAVRGGSDLTLSVTREQAQALTLAQGEGSLAVSLRNPDDIVVQADTPITTPQDIHLAEKRARLQARRGTTTPPAAKNREIEHVD